MESMSESDVRELVLQRLGLRLGPEMTTYVWKHLNSGAASAVPAIGGNARTGVRISVEVPADLARVDPAQAAPTAQ